MAAGPEAPAGVGGRTRRSLGISVLDSYLGVALQLASTVLLARLLTPEEFGVFAVAAVFSALASSMRTFGVAEYLIQQRELSTATLRAAFAVVLMSAWTLGLLINLIAPLVAAFYGRAEIGHVLHVLSISFFVTPIGAITLACCRRDMRMGPIFVASLSANIVSFAVAIGLALQGAGTMSLAISVVSGSITTALVALFFRPPDLPRWPSLTGTPQILRFGKHVSGIFLFGQMGNGAPEMIIGKAAGVVPVAFFSRAHGLVELFNRVVLQAIWPVLLPALAEKARGAPGELNVAFLRGTSLLTVVAWPILAGMALLAWPAVRIVYGVQWLEAVPLAPVLCLSAAIGVAYHLAKDSLLALGLAKECNALQLKVQGLRMAGILLVVPFGLMGACWGIVAGTAAGAWLTHRALGRALGGTFGGATPIAALAGAWAPSALVTVIAAVPLVPVLWLLPPAEGNYLRLAVAGAGSMLIAWLLALRFTRHPMWAEVVGLTRQVARRAAA
jgi:O-antigen/teichoic acid export membrane protein